MTGRRVVASSTQELYRTGRRRGWAAFTKLPETKHELFTAKTRTHGELVADLEKLPADEPVQVQERVVFTDEVRCWVRDGSVVAHAAYFADVPREDWPADPAHAAPAAIWLTRVLDSGTVPVPAAVTIDVGWCADPLTGDPG